MNEKKKEMKEEERKKERKKKKGRKEGREKGRKAPKRSDKKSLTLQKFISFVSLMLSVSSFFIPQINNLVIKFLNRK